MLTKVESIGEALLWMSQHECKLTFEPHEKPHYSGASIQIVIQVRIGIDCYLASHFISKRVLRQAPICSGGVHQTRAIISMVNTVIAEIERIK